jgi:multiple sugar transport system permease protein
MKGAHQGVAGRLARVLPIFLPLAFFPFGVYVSCRYYSNALPPSLLDAARIDGCNEWQVFRRVALPLAKPVIGLVFFVSFTANWGNFLPFVALTNPRQYTIQVGLTDVLTTASRPELALATLIAAVPLAIVFVLCQSTLRHGLFGSTLKG